MALVQNDTVILFPVLLLTAPPKYGVVITAGANPVISWEGNPSVTYTGLAAPAGVLKVALAAPASISTWLLKKVNLIPGGISPNGSAVGVVVNVCGISGLAVDAFADNLVVRNAEGLYQAAPIAAWQLLPNQ
jgi:hypothetical protein